MISWSMPAAVSSTLHCHELVHPGCNSCSKHLLKVAAKTFKGAGAFFLLFQTVGAIRNKAVTLRENKNSRLKNGDSWDTFGKNFLRFQLFCVSIASGTLGLSCFFRYLLGRYWRLTTVFLPATISGFSSYLMDPKTRLLGAILLTNSVLSLHWTRIAHTKGIHLSKIMKTSIFMVLSSLVSGLIVKTGNCPPFWFFNPLVEKTDADGTQRCCHSHSCNYHIISNLSSYFTVGLSVTILKFLFKNGARALSQPKILVNFFTRASNLSMALFCGLYSCIFQSIRCYLTRNKSHSDVGVLVAGFLAGSSFFFYPSTSILNFAIITAIQVIYNQLSKTDGAVSKTSYSTIMFALAAGYLFDANFLSMDCPSFPKFLINSATGGEGEIIAKHIRENILQSIVR